MENRDQAAVIHGSDNYEPNSIKVNYGARSTLSSMRILAISRRFPPDSFGGGEISAQTWCKLLATNHDVHVITTGKGEVEKHEFTVHRLIPPVTQQLPFDIHNNEIFYRKAQKALEQFLENESFDIIHAFNMFSIPPSVSAGRKKDIPVVATVNDHWGTCFFRSHFHDGKVVEVCTKSIIKQNIKKEMISPLATPYILHAMKFRRKALQNCRKLIAISSRVKHILEKNGLSDVTVIHNPVDFETFKPEKFRDTKKILFIGRLDYGKGIETLIKAAAQARKDVEFNLVFAGTGHENRFKKMAQEHKIPIEFLGKVDHKDVPEVIHNSDLIVASFERVEAFGRAVSEAAACGRAVITTDIAGCVDIVEDGRSGMIVPPGNPEALSKAIVGLVSDKEKLAAMGMEGRRIVEDRLDEEVLIEKLTNVYERVLQDKRETQSI
jgi:glycosyltransferase involved in cell wall biosynthesis